MRNHLSTAELFEAALSLKPSERTAFLDRVCLRDSALRRTVENLLAEDARAGSFLQRPAFDFLNNALGDSAATVDTPCITDSNGNPSGPGLIRSFDPGQVLVDRFVIVRLIAKGGMGEVYEAEDRFLQGVHVALKTILPRVADEPSLQKRFEREVLLAREVVHPNLCPIYDLFRCDQPPSSFLFLTMKLLPGETLAERLQTHSPVSNEEGLAILKQAAFGLAAIHAAGIIHRDIKPNNMILDGVDAHVRLWITDFGLARALESETTLSGRHAVAGTPGYIAPELLEGHPPSQASDLYAFGVVIHEIFTGQRPVAATDGSSVVVNPRMNTSSVPTLCSRLVRGCLSPEPIRRCEAFEQALDMLGAKQRARKPWTRRQFIGASAAGACVLAAGGWVERDSIYDLLHPLPGKRFVALMDWPRVSDNKTMPMLTGALAAIKGELARLEAFDRNLFVISPDDIGQDLTGATHLKDYCAPLGANLALVASAYLRPTYFELLLRLFDPSSNHLLRQSKVTCALAEITTLPAKATNAAASLLGLNHYLHNETSDPGTQSTAAFTAFQSAEALMKKPNDSGLDAAIEKYKEAVELDPRYATAYAELAIAYGRLYALHRDPAALDLAHANCQAALALSPNLVDGHLALSSVLRQTGDEQGALDEIAKALALDPSNPNTLVWQGQLYTRLNRWADAESAFKRVLNERPNFWLAYNELGVAFNRQGKYQEAIEAFRKACLAAPGNAMAFNNVGAIDLQLGNFADATDNFKKSLALNPNGMAAANTSLALRSQRNYADALPFARKSVNLDPGNDSNWLELADCYSSLGTHKKDAEAAYLRAAAEVEKNLQVDPANGPTWMSLALYQVKSGTGQNALSLVRKAESLSADDLDSQLTKARIFELLGKRDEALTTLAACFHRGATRFEIAPIPDLQSLQKDPRYQEILRSNSAGMDTPQLSAVTP
jgi:tetratricopeptide (TPR) repeat protein/tRNA A-37 threonylcarbamoyl transferase component Bud32